MRIQHNMTAANTNRQLGITTGNLAKSTEKLSSGYAINRASISEEIAELEKEVTRIGNETEFNTMKLLNGGVKLQVGATQNRLEYTISNANNTSENLTTAESRIRDVDMAAEMVNYSKNNILQQAAQSMLSQANQSTQGVLSLLR